MEARFHKGDNVRIIDLDLMEEWGIGDDEAEAEITEEGELVDPSKATAPWVDRNAPAYFSYEVLACDGQMELSVNEDQIASL